MSNPIKVDDLEIDIVANYGKASKALRDLASKFKDTASAASSSTSSVKDMGNAAGAASREMKDFSGATSIASRNVQDMGAASSDGARQVGDLSKTQSQASKTGRQFTESNKDNSRSLKELGNSAKRSTSKLHSFFRTVGRIAMYRAIRSAIRGITSAFAEGLDMFVTWDRNRNNGMAGAADAVDQIKNKWGEVKASIGAAVAPIIQSLKPAIDKILDGVINLFNYIQQVVRALRGEQKWYKAVYKEAKNTTGEAEKLQRILFGFDELNVLPSKSGKSSGSEVGEWVYELEDIPPAIELVKTGFTGLLTILGGAGLLGIVKGLINGFRKKNSLLGEQSTRTAEDAAQSLVLSGALGSVLAAATGLNSYLEKNPSNVQINAPVLDFTEQQEAVSELQEWCDANAIELGLKIRADYETSMQEGLKAGMLAGAAASSVTAQVPVVVNTSGIGTALSSALSDYQKQLNNNPLKVPVQVGNSVTGKGSANIKVTNVNGVSTVKNSAKASAEMDGLLAASGAAAALAALGGSSGSYTKGAISKANADKALQELFTNTQSRKDLYWQGIDKGWENFEKYVMNDSTASVAATAGATGVLADILKLLPILGFANGGEPNVGSLFYAGEGRTQELVTHMNGRTKVLNTSQMEDAVSVGNNNVVEALYAIGKQIVQSVEGKNTNVYLDGQKVGQSVIRYQNNQARRGIPQLG